MQHPQDGAGGPAAEARRPSFDYHHAIGMQGGVYMHYTVQVSSAELRRLDAHGAAAAPYSSAAWMPRAALRGSSSQLTPPHPLRSAPQAHTDLRAPPSTPLLSTQHGRAAGPRALEPGVVEYSQDGGVLFTTGEARCPTVAALLGAEKASGTYLAGLGPAGARVGGAARRGAALVRGGRGPRGKAALAPRALVLIDTSSGRRYKASTRAWGEGGTSGCGQDTESAQKCGCSVPRAPQWCWPASAAGLLQVTRWLPALRLPTHPCRAPRAPH